MADGGKDDAGGIALAALEMAAAKVSVGVHVTDHRFDGRSAPEFAFDHPKDPARLAGDEDAARVCGFVAAIALVDIGALDWAAGELLGGFDGFGERVAVIRVGPAAPWRAARTGRPGHGRWW